MTNEMVGLEWMQNSVEAYENYSKAEKEILKHHIILKEKQ